MQEPVIHGYWITGFNALFLQVYFSVPPISRPSGKSFNMQIPGPPPQAC